MLIELFLNVTEKNYFNLSVEEKIKFEMLRIVLIHFLEIVLIVYRKRHLKNVHIKVLLQ